MFEVEYDGQYHEAPTLNAALDRAKQLVTEGAYRLDGCTVEQDEVTSTWYVQGVLNGRRVGAAVTIPGPDAGTPLPARNPAPDSAAARRLPVNHPVYADTEFDGWSRRVVISGATPAEVFEKAATWLASQRSPVQVTAVRHGHGKVGRLGV